MQGTASFSTTPDRQWLESIDANWERFMGPRDRGFPWEWWTNAYQWERIGVKVAVERVLSWPDLSCRSGMAVHGRAVPADPGPQQAPRNGTRPRVDLARAQRRIARLPDTLLGWVSADGYPMVIPVSQVRAVEHGMVCEVPEGLVPGGGRRAGLTAHWFSEGVLGQEQRVHTGWLEAEPGATEVLYAPHTQSGYRLPPSKLLYRVAVGGLARHGLRQARRAGFVTTARR